MVPPFEPHTTGHWHLENGALIRVDWMGGRWCVSRFTPQRALHDQVYGSDEVVHYVARLWARV